MIVQRPASARGHSRHDGHDSRHAFSFGGYYDPAWMGFGPLRVLNEDRFAPGAGIGAQRHANMEILTYVVDGALVHRDDAGHETRVPAGALQWLGAGHGMVHGEANASATEPLHRLQMWIQPSRLNHEPARAHRDAVPPDARGWGLLASADGRDGSLAIRQDACLSQLRLDRGETAQVELDRGRLYWLHVVSGQVVANGDTPLAAGDALGLQDEAGTLALQGAGDGRALVLLFDLPQ
ncbi:MAG TPA: pirin family protein [Lysobacter sp.]